MAERQRERGRERIPSRLHAVSTELTVAGEGGVGGVGGLRLDPTNHEIVT